MIYLFEFYTNSILIIDLLKALLNIYLKILQTVYVRNNCLNLSAFSREETLKWIWVKVNEIHHVCNKETQTQPKGHAPRKTETSQTIF